jgi:class 3 adenylate cyclase/tetratricopeptide (TPR) repeat protein
VLCPSCGFENREGRKFCAECGAPLALACAACGAANEPGERFCGECGAALAAQPRDEPAPAQPAAERRLVSVLFADLVGFTSASEGRDAEETRELLSRYFDTCRQLIERYGGTVEKFIGDAVMAVWGTPTAREDDPERAVRAALDLVGSVSDLDPALNARAGVLTGEAAVTIGAKSEGMVAGDLVNTASRIQAAAGAGTVLVGETTRRASEAAIAYESAGTHELKGKAELVPLWRALRVTAARGGARRSTGLEPPYVGRERELRLVKELFHACADEGKAHLVSVVGIGGMGKSRVAWEFEKYIDGVAERILWHRGRCLAYGEGVTYWALAEMVRMRAEIAEGEDPPVARGKLGKAVETYVTDSEEREWVEPRLAHLLGLEERQAREREDLFAAWRLFFERMAESSPTVLVFEDLHWADAAMLEFVEYLLEWSRSHPIYVLTLARPELIERHPQWGAGKRTFTSISLEPLPQTAMEGLLSAFVPGLPEGLNRQILTRAEGVPLYAVETVRMLLDRGLLKREGDAYRPTGPIEALDVPETLHALVAARLDGLEPEERRLIQDASVLGKSFSKEALAAVSSSREDELEPVLASLVRKEVVSLQADPRSPERGQYGFLQDLLRYVAYETLARRERKARHLAAAAHLESAFGPAEHEIVEVLAAHYVAAFEAAPDDADAAGIKTNAAEMLTRAGERAASLAASEEAERYFSQAADLAGDPVVRAQLHERAGEMAAAGARADQAQAHYGLALELFEAEGHTHPAARVSARLGEVEWKRGELAQAVEQMERALGVLSGDEPDADLAALTAQLSRLHFFSGNLDRAEALIETGLALAESLGAPEILAEAMNTYGVISGYQGRLETALALYTHALKIALEHDLPTPAFRSYNNLADSLGIRDRHEEALREYESGVKLARKVGNRQWEWQLLLESTYPLMLLGRWDEALARFAETAQSEARPRGATGAALVVEIEAARGRTAEAQGIRSLLSRPGSPTDVQERSLQAVCAAVVFAAEGRYAEALSASEEAVELRGLLGTGHQFVKAGFVQGLEAAFALGRLEKVEHLLAKIDALEPGELAPFLRAHGSRFRARLAAARGESKTVERPFKAATRIFREFGILFWLAVTLLEHGEWLTEEGRSTEAEPLLAEAREILERLKATPWLERLDQAGAGTAVAAG